MIECWRIWSSKLVDMKKGIAETRTSSTRNPFCCSICTFYFEPTSLREAIIRICFAGPQLEAAWRARHKWAAQKASKVMVDVYDSPPLKPYVSAAQQLSIGFVMLLNGYPGTSDSYQNTLGIEIGRSAFLEQPLSLMASYPGGKNLN